ncbi:MAG: metallophosphoesterase family protein [Clostridiales bacterium]|nr:metallophosphoesterase family protein [Clostridiales bacterium]
MHKSGYRSANHFRNITRISIASFLVILHLFMLCCVPAFAEDTFSTPGLIIEIGEKAGDLRFSWMTDEDGAYTLLLAPAPLVTNGIFPPESYRTSFVQTADGIYTAYVVHLEENTEYSYRIVDGSGNIRSNIYSFYLPSRDSFTFLFLGDPQIRSYEAEADGAMWANTMDNALALYPQSAFVTVAGDLGDVAKKAEYLAFRSPESLKSIPVAPNRGNHDAKSEYYDEQFSEPNANGCSYYFTYGDVLVVALDSNIYKYHRHKEFLENAIAAENKRWVIVTMHHSIYSVGEHATGSTVTSMRPEYAAMFKELNVDLVLSGHDHRYCRTYIMDGEDPTEKKVGIKQPGETLYISSGSASGTKYYDLAKRVDSFKYVAYYLKNKEPVYTAIHVTNDRLFIVTHAAEGMRIIDTCVIEKE